MKNTTKNFLLVTLALVSFGAVANAKSLSVASKGDELVYDKTSLTAKPGEAIKLTFKNGSAKAAGLQHNLVLVKPGTMDAVSAASIAAGAEKGWLAESPDIIVHTKLLDSGKSETLSFKAPTTPGDYPYFCSFPGHNAMMKGILHVK
jgi:azurin